MKKSSNEYIDNLIYTFISIYLQFLNATSGLLLSLLCVYFSIHYIEKRHKIMGGIFYLLYYLFYRVYTYNIDQNDLFTFLEYNLVSFIIGNKIMKLNEYYLLISSLLSILIILNFSCENKQKHNDERITVLACPGDPNYILPYIKNFNSGFLHLIIFFVIIY